MIRDGPTILVFLVSCAVSACGGHFDVYVKVSTVRLQHGSLRGVIRNGVHCPAHASRATTGHGIEERVLSGTEICDGFCSASITDADGVLVTVHRDEGAVGCGLTDGARRHGGTAGAARQGFRVTERTHDIPQVHEIVGGIVIHEFTRRAARATRHGFTRNERTCRAARRFDFRGLYGDSERNTTPTNEITNCHDLPPKQTIPPFLALRGG